MKITENTTLAELQLEASKEGVTFVSMRVQPGGILVGMQAMDHDDEKFVLGEGATIAEAIDDAFTKFRGSVMARIAREVTRPIVQPK